MLETDGIKMKFVLLESDYEGGAYITHFNAKNLEDAWEDYEDGTIGMNEHSNAIIMNETDFQNMCENGVKNKK